MKLSDAIEVGSRGRKQVRGEFECNGGVCALGAAAVGAGLPLDGDLSDTLIQTFPALRRIVRYQKRTGRGPATVKKETLFDRIANLNDKAKLGFPNIIAYLRRRGL